MNNGLFFIFVPLVAVSFLYDSISISSFGISLILLLGCLIYTVLHGLNRQNRSVTSFFKQASIRNVFFIYILFVLCCLISHIGNGSTTASDYQYIASLAGQALWFPVIWYLVQRGSYSFEGILQAAVILIFGVIVLFWILGLLLHGNPFFLRSVGSPFDSIPLAPHLFENPNRTARFLLILLVFTIYFSYVSTIRSAKYWKYAMYILCGLVFFTLSRSGIVSMLVLMAVAILSQKELSKKVFYSAGISVLGLCIVVFIPGVLDRILQAISTIASLDTRFQTSVLDNSISIRARSWSASYQIMKDNPAFGVGTSNALAEMGNYGALAWKGGNEVRAIWVHGGFLKIGVYAGLLGLTPFFFFVFSLGKAFYYNYLSFRYIESRQKYASLLGIAGLLASIPVNIGADFFTIGLVWFMFAYLLSCSSMRRE